MNRPASWRDFDRRQQTEAETARPDTVTMADICARLLTTADGQEFMRHLYAAYVDQRSRPGAPDADLREAEAKRRLVFDLERLRDDGLQRIADRAKTPAA